jgi:hypothetical protein
MIHRKTVHRAVLAIAFVGLAVNGTSRAGTATQSARETPRAIQLDDQRSAATTSPTTQDGEKKEPGEPIPVDKLPKVVVNAVKKDIPGARITKAAKIEKDGKIDSYYLDSVMVGKEVWDVTVSADGKTIKKEKSNDND